MTKKHTPVSVVKSDSTYMSGIDLIAQGFILDTLGHSINEEAAYSFIIKDGKAIIESTPLPSQPDTKQNATKKKKK